MSSYEKIQQFLMRAELQNARLLRLFFPRKDGPDALMVANRLEGAERMSRDFEFKVEVLSNRPDIALKSVLGKMVTIELRRKDDSLRYFNGFAFSFRFVKNDGGFSFYELVLRPWLAFLRYRQDNRIFHNLSLREQSGKVFERYLERDWRIAGLGEDPVMTDAFQYEESDYNYLHRRWEHLGWVYWYEHRKDGHTLVLSDESARAEPLDGGGAVFWKGEHPERVGMASFSAVREVASTHYAVTNFNFKHSSYHLPAEARGQNLQGEIPALEVHEYAGAYGHRPGEGEALAARRMAELDAQGKHYEGAGDDDHCQAGRYFTLANLWDEAGLGTDKEDNQFLLIEVRHTAGNNYEVGLGQGGNAEYTNEIVCLRRKIPWKPGRGYNSEETRIYGAQTATVVGPAGEEIHTDEYGRVRVQFNWDREGEYDARSSAWIRVGTPLAGDHFGFISLPRVNQEVIVQWLDGNPDRPIITGQVYNDKNMPPWSLPGNKTQSGILTRSTLKGGYDNANALRFEDKKGEEQVWLHAEKNQDIEVEHDETHWVGNDRTKTIDHDETVHVKHDRTETVDNDETITIHHNRTETVDNDESITIHNNRTEKVDHNETISIGDNRTEKVGQNETISIGGNRSVKIGGNKSETISQAKTETIALAKALTIGLGYQTTVGGMMNTTVGLSQSEQVLMSKTENIGKSYTLDVGDELVITVGKSKFVMKSDGTVTLNGVTFKFEASGQVEVIGNDIKLN